MISGRPDDFKSRVDAIFGALDTTDEAEPSSKGWSLSEKQVYRPGKDASYSSEEEEEARRDQAEREDVLGEALSLEDQAAEGQELPSRAFCKAIDNEQEFDANDVIASGIIEGPKDLRPSRQTQVLDDNIFEKSSRSKATGRLPLQSSFKPLEEGFETKQDHSLALQSSKADSRGTASSHQQPSLDWGASKPPLPARPPQKQQRGKGISFVPDHVKHPERYTVYELDEPLEVGSGDFRGADSQPRSLREGGQHEGEGAESDTARDLPDFGGGIAFTPKEKAKAAAGTRLEAQGQQGNPDVDGLLSMAQQIASDPEDVAMEEAKPIPEDSLNAPTEFVPKARRQRNIRNRG